MRGNSGMREVSARGAVPTRLRWENVDPLTVSLQDIDASGSDDSGSDADLDAATMTPSLRQYMRDGSWPTDVCTAEASSLSSPTRYNCTKSVVSVEQLVGHARCCTRGSSSTAAQFWDDLESASALFAFCDASSASHAGSLHATPTVAAARKLLQHAGLHSVCKDDWWELCKRLVIGVCVCVCVCVCGARSVTHLARAAAVGQARQRPTPVAQALHTRHQHVAGPSKCLLVSVVAAIVLVCAMPILYMLSDRDQVAQLLPSTMGGLHVRVVAGCVGIVVALLAVAGAWAGSVTGPASVHPRHVQPAGSGDGQTMSHQCFHAMHTGQARLRQQLRGIERAELLHRGRREVGLWLQVVLLVTPRVCALPSQTCQGSECESHDHPSHGSS